ncbi:unnamed protein product [Rotaria sordida]|uniref:Secretory carrier-associated membrane protein n=1 Tax=Rotaria sordida TaxID=392033 RepID=A0A815A5E8_9BILA|nr:unnamed protein product [Rotaria sordida]CAF1250866.1 unnamed protein product [Rotaria sordida]CAF3572366.1 unnamed protein product [Rotaria sordida]CAF3940414.1 unnamed protein product [Rotaria sordida]
MNIDDDINPFADPSIREATAQTLSNQQTLYEYNPFENRTISDKSKSSKQDNIVTSVTSNNQQESSTSIHDQQTTNIHSNNDNRFELTQFDRRQAELEQREKRLMERERVLTNLQFQHTEKNFPRLPQWCPIRPCFYQDISIEIPIEFQLWVRYLYYLWLLYSSTLAFNFIGALSYFIVDKEGGTTFGLSILYLILFIPLSYLCWFRPLYRAFRSDRSSDFMIFFFIFFFQILISIFMLFGWKNSGFCGFILMIRLFSAGGSKIAVGIIVMIVTLTFAIIALANVLLLFKIHRLYRQSGATIEQAQQEFQSAFVNNPTVRGAAQQIGSSRINQT